MSMSTKLTPMMAELNRRRPRKPMWMPMAKTKLFRISDRPALPPRERDEMFRLYAYYKTAARAVTQLFERQVRELELSAATATSENARREEEIDHAKAVSINERWNLAVAQDRERRLAEDRARRRAAILDHMEEVRAREEENRRRIAAEILKLKEDVEHFVTRETLDEAIECALANRVDYNYALTMDGKILEPEGVAETETKESKK